MTVDYYHSTDSGGDYLMKRVRDPARGILTGFMWNVPRKEWVEDWELTSGYFYGFEPATWLTSEQAIGHLVRKGCTKEEAEAQIKKDQAEE